MFLLHNDLPSVISIHHRCHFVCMTSIHWLLLWTCHCSGYLFPVYLFSALFANQIRICFMPATRVTGFVSFAFRVCWLMLNRWLLYCTYCIWHYLLTRHWFVQCSSTCTLGLSYSIILIQWLLLWTSHSFNTFIFHLGTLYLHHLRQSLPYFVCFWFEEYGVQPHSIVNYYKEIDCK